MEGLGGGGSEKEISPWVCMDGGASRTSRRKEEGGIGAEEPATTLGLNPK